MKKIKIGLLLIVFLSIINLFFIIDLCRTGTISISPPVAMPVWLQWFMVHDANSKDTSFRP